MFACEAPGKGVPSSLQMQEAALARPKFQMVFSPDGKVEMHIRVGDELRKTDVDLTDAPFAKSMLTEKIVSATLEAWMLETNGPSWMSWTDVEAALLSAGIDMERLIAAHPVSAAG